MNRSLSPQDEAAPDTGAQRIEMAVEALRAAIPQVQAIYLFGSHAKGRSRSESDIDLAVLTSDPLPIMDTLDIESDLASMLKAEVDLIDLGRATTVLQMQVVSTGRVIYDGDVPARHRFEMRVLSAYALLNEERAEILERIHGRGRVYEDYS